VAKIEENHRNPNGWLKKRESHQRQRSRSSNAAKIDRKAAAYACGVAIEKPKQQKSVAAKPGNSVAMAGWPVANWQRNGGSGNRNNVAWQRQRNETASARSVAGGLA